MELEVHEAIYGARDPPLRTVCIDVFDDNDSSSDTTRFSEQLFDVLCMVQDCEYEGSVEVVVFERQPPAIVQLRLRVRRQRQITHIHRCHCNSALPAANR